MVRCGRVHHCVRHVVARLVSTAVVGATKREGAAGAGAEQNLLVLSLMWQQAVQACGLVHVR